MADQQTHKIYYLGAFDSSSKPAINIQQCDDLGSFSFYQRSSVREFLVFMAKTVAERTENGQRQSVQENNYTAHVFRQGNYSGKACDLSGRSS